MNQSLGPNSRVRTKDGRNGVVLFVNGEIAEVMFPEEAEEFINISDLVLAGPVGPVKQLLEYCKLDTFGMVQIVKKLREFFTLICFDKG